MRRSRSCSIRGGWCSGCRWARPRSVVCTGHRRRVGKTLMILQREDCLYYYYGCLEGFRGRDGFDGSLNAARALQPDFSAQLQARLQSATPRKPPVAAPGIPRTREAPSRILSPPPAYDSTRCSVPCPNHCRSGDRALRSKSSSPLLPARNGLTPDRPVRRAAPAGFPLRSLARPMVYTCGIFRKKMEIL